MSEFVPEWPLAQLQPADYNPRRIKAGAFEKLKESIARFGVVKPVILNRDGTLVAGHQRTKAMQAIGMTTTPAMILPKKANRQDEINFNLMHNSVETESAEGRIVGDLPFGYSFVEWDRIDARTGGSAGGGVTKEIGALISTYGGWGSVVVSEDGTIIANADYAVASRATRTPLLVYRMPDNDVPSFAVAMGVDYGEYFFDALEVKTYSQTHAQLNRLRGRRDENGELLPHSTDTESRIYSRLVTPFLEELLPEKPRIVDFGAGHGDHARRLREQGWPILTYEPHLRFRGKGEAFDVKQIVRTVQALGRDVERHGLFPLVVLDSVINSVTTLEFVDAVFTCVNALCAADGTLFTNARSLEATRTARRTTKNTGDARRIEFFDDNNFSAVYFKGVWQLQLFHEKEEFAAIARKYFGHVRARGSDHYHRFEMRDPLPLGEDKYRWALDLELNMPLPGEFQHGRHVAARDAIVKAAVARDTVRVSGSAS